MRSDDASRRSLIAAALASSAVGPVGPAVARLLHALGYRSRRTVEYPARPELFLREIERGSSEPTPFRRDVLRVDEWRECAFVFQLTNDEIPFLASDTLPLGLSTELRRNQIESLLFIAIDLGPGRWSRAELAKVTRELNRRFPNPVVPLFRHGPSEAGDQRSVTPVLSMAVIDRRASLKDGSRDVVENRISIIKDVRLDRPHRAHVDILSELAFGALATAPSNFNALYDAWMSVLSTEALNKKFYKDLSEWFFWATHKVKFPKGGGKDRDNLGVIRLLTRLIFIWFIKELGLVPDELFEPRSLAGLLKNDPSCNPEGNDFYLAVLQNLFFATLNVDQEVIPRSWADSRGGGMTNDYLVHSRYRHKELFKKPDEVMALFKKVPFLNGGLFECLDRELTDRDLKRDPELKTRASKEGNQTVLRVDGFSRRPEAQPTVPNALFFNGATRVDLNDDFGTKNKPYDPRGLLRIFNAYKFTVDENTPVEEEVALDPELLGKVFENLLASYNEDTRTAARKLSGSFYTKRYVVDYMVDEALLVYFERHLPEHPERESKLRALLGYRDENNPFSREETAALIAAIEKLRLIDPACGSGAFPMGALAKLVHVLSKLDPDDVLWKAQNRAPLEAQLQAVERIPDPTLQEQRRAEAVDALQGFDRTFAEGHHASYTRKLYLIEKCIHGVDIQPVAVQIAKLRFFISLVVSQEVDRSKSNGGILALPNLETRIIAADSLMSVGEGGQQVLRDQEIIKREKELARESRAYFVARRHVAKKKARERISTLRDEIASLLATNKELTKSDAKHLGSWDPFDQNASADFFDPKWMFQMTEDFDVCLGNPPYVRQEHITERKDDYKKLFDSFSGTADLYVYFYERSVKLLKPGGAFAFITSNKWYRAKYGEKLRDWMKRETRLLRVIDFGDAPVFDAIAYPTIVIAARRMSPVARPANDEQVQAFNWVAGAREVEEFPEVFAKEHFEVPQAELMRDGWQLEVPTKRRLLDRIRGAGVPLGEYVKGRFYYGIKTGLNEAFVISGLERQKLVAEHRDSTELIKPFLRGRDVKRWRVDSDDQWLLFVPWHFPLHLDPTIRGTSTKAEAEFKRRYPAVYRHLSGYRTELEGRNIAETGVRYEWYALQRWGADYWEEFEAPKIIMGRFMDKPTYAFDGSGFYVNNALSFVAGASRYLLGVLNSAVTWWYLRQICTDLQGGFLQVHNNNQATIPISRASHRQVDVVEGVVAGILNRTDPSLERLLNGLVYELYFPEDLHTAGIHLFDAAESAGVARLATLEGVALAKAAQELITTLKDNASLLYRYIYSLRTVDVVRIIEGEA